MTLPRSARLEGLRPARSPALRRPLAWLLALAALARSRRQLARLDARLLEDAGLSRGEALEEARRRLWDVPPHWRL